MSMINTVIMPPKIWIVPVGIDKEGTDHKEELSKIEEEYEWTVPSKSKVDDLILFYFNSPESCINDNFKITGESERRIAGAWANREYDWFAPIERIAKIPSPIKYKDIKDNTVLKNSQFVAIHMAGRCEVTAEHWKELYNLIIRKQRNEDLKKKLEYWSPDKIYRYFSQK